MRLMMEARVGSKQPDLLSSRFSRSFSSISAPKNSLDTTSNNASGGTAGPSSVPSFASSSNVPSTTTSEPAYYPNTYSPTKTTTVPLSGINTHDSMLGQSQGESETTGDNGTKPKRMSRILRRLSLSGKGKDLPRGKHTAAMNSIRCAQVQMRDSIMARNTFKKLQIRRLILTSDLRHFTAGLVPPRMRILDLNDWVY